MGVVLRAHDRQLDRDVALKVLAHHRIDEAFLRECFMREARTLASVRHPNVVEIFAYEEWRGMPVLVMEYLPSGSLDEEIDARMGAPLSLERVRSLLQGMCEGVEVIHRSGVVHRDLKTANVLLGGRGGVKLADFGLAALIDSKLAGDAVGTPAYMSPEALAAEAHVQGEGRRSDDMWGLAVMAYELLTGVRPFGEGGFDDVMSMQLSGPPLPPSQVRGALPAELDAFFLRALSPDLTQRPARARDFAELFAQASGGRSPSAGRRARRIMVVDDDPDFLSYLCAVIEDEVEDVVVESFEDPEKLLAAAQAERVDLVLSDLDMPQTDGHALTERLRSDARTKEVPVIVLTASGSASDWQQLRDRGADAFLVKPVDPKTLASAIERSLDRAKVG